MKPEWRTPTVLALMAAADAAGDYSCLPALSDALEEAGCDDAELLGFLRAPGPLARWYRRVVEGTHRPLDVGAAFARLDGLAKAASVYEDYHRGPDYVWYPETKDDGLDFEWLYGVCARFHAGTERWDSVHTFHGRNIPACFTTEAVRQMWRDYETLTGTPPPDEQTWEPYLDEIESNPQYPFSCSC